MNFIIILYFCIFVFAKSKTNAIKYLKYVFLQFCFFAVVVVAVGVTIKQNITKIKL